MPIVRKASGGMIAAGDPNEQPMIGRADESGQAADGVTPPPDLGGNAQGPRDLHPSGIPTTIAPQEPQQATHGATEPSQATPSQPQEPTPVATQTPQPFTPMAPSMSMSASTQAGDLSPIVRRGLVPGSADSGGSRLLGKADGLLGGGMGVAGLGGGDDLGQLLAQLMKLAAGGQR